MAQINCTRCQRKLTLPPGAGPVTVTCPGCGKKMDVQRTSREPRDEPPDGTRRFTGKHWALVGLGSGAAVLALAVGVWLVMAGPSKEVIHNTGPAVGGPPGQGARGIGEARDMARRGPEGRKVAVLVGVNRYRHSALNGNRPLQYAENDVVELRDVLSQAGYTVHLLTGDRATLGNIRAALETARAQTADGGVFLVGLAGHGFQPEKSDSAYFCPYDADKRVVADRDDDPWDYESMLPLEVVLGHLKASSAGSRVLMMDACRNDPLAGRGRGVGTNLKISEIPNTAVLLSCSQGQKSFEDKAWGGGHGVFFHHVLTGLRGEEESVIADGKIDLDLLVAYLKKAVPKQVKEVAKDPFSGVAPDQNPHRIVNGNVDLLISAKGVNGPISSPKFDNPVTPPASLPQPVPDDSIPARLPPAWPNGGNEKVFEIANGVRMTFCWVPAGEVQLGSPKAEQEYHVKTYNDGKRPQWMDGETEAARGTFKTMGFWLGKYEVQQSEWEGVMGDNPSQFKGANLPVETVSWSDCKKFIDKCGLKGLKLPHEDEWEYACRGGKGNLRAFYWGDVLNGAEANCVGTSPYGTTTKGESKGKTMPVGSYKDQAVHPWGLCDMSGNVLEWCENLYTNAGSLRIVRGGYWNGIAVYCRSAERHDFVPSSRFNFLGFRLALVP